jgi:hypothetical protein
MYGLKEFRDFNMFKALEMIGDDIGIHKQCEDMKDLEDYLLMEYNEGDGEFYEQIDKESYIVIADLVEETLVKKIYTAKLESKDIDVIGIQILLDEETKAKEKKAAELAELNERMNKK